MLKCKICNHEQPEISVHTREICRGCGKGPENESAEAWNEFMGMFEEFDEDYGIAHEPY